MCKFISGIGLKNGDLICDLSIESHKLLIRQNELNDQGSVLRNWVRLEYYPDSNSDLGDPSKYNLHIDDSNFDWITDELKEKWIRKFNTKLKKAIVSEDRVYLPAGVFILVGKITIQNAGYAVIRNAGDATIQDAWHATIQNAGHATIQDAWRATIQNAGHAVIRNAWEATIQDAWEATIQDAGDATIQNAGHATIQRAGDATITNKQDAKIS